MFAQIEYPEKLLPEDLDNYLAKGWFRMRQTIFTTNFLHFHHRFFSAIWLRVVLNDSIYDKRFFNLRKLNKHFTFEVKKSAATFSAMHELLYQFYRQSISFDVSPSLQELLIGTHNYNRFNTYEVNIYDGINLIAAGFFDLGTRTAAGITCIYHPFYKKYSLGKYLMYLKMDYCKHNGLLYFYPGYFVPGYKSFDYKTEIGKNSLQYLQLATRQWINIMPSAAINDPLQLMVEKLTYLKACIINISQQNTILYYKFFEANLDPFYYGEELFDYPVFLYFHSSSSLSFPYKLIIYNIFDLKFHLIECISVIINGEQQSLSVLFDLSLLKQKSELFATENAEEMSIHLPGFLKENIQSPIR